MSSIIRGNDGFNSNFNELPEKVNIINDDYVALSDSEDSHKLKKLSWANLKATLLTYFSLGFASSLTTNGYIKFPNWLGGLIIQCGNISHGTTVSVSFPIAYPTKCASVVCIQSNADNILATYGVLLISSLGFSSRCSRTDTAATYISIGY